MSESLTLFKTKLANDEYVSLTGAKRAIGKFREMPDSDRDKARAMAEKHFAGNPAPAKKVAKKAPAKKKAAKKTKRALHPNNVAKKAAAKKAPVKGKHGPGKGRAPEAAKGSKAVAKRSSSPKKPTPKPESRLADANKVMGMTKETIASAKAIRDIDPEFDVTNLLTLAAEGVEAAQRSAMQVVGVHPRPRSSAAPNNGAGKAASPPMGSPGTTMPGVNAGSLPGLPKQE
jgi:hypothetical protein